jgi:transcriptional regulator with XRE-family HTH domain
MGRMKRPSPLKLAEKLLQIRERLELSQNGMLRKLGLEDDYARTAISSFERGEKEPPLTVLLRYAQVANICLDVLADDKQSLPHALPAKKRIH